MSQKDDDFIKLKELWYRKLKESGFKDIERSNGRLKAKAEDLCLLKRYYNEETFKEKQNYYFQASQFYWDYKFESKLQKEIWRLHSEGFSLRQISRRIRTSQNKMSKDKIKNILGPLKKIVYSRIMNE